ncbi:MAG: three-helix bundle dimerization domain-containing protein [Anaerolineales bacterium]|jgi:hypothetical protein
MSTVNEVFVESVVDDQENLPSDFVDDGLVESLWQDLEGRVSHAQIRQTAREVAASYDGATVMTFITIFIRRQTLERLKTI